MAYEENDDNEIVSETTEGPIDNNGLESQEPVLESNVEPEDEEKFGETIERPKKKRESKVQQVKSNSKSTSKLEGEIRKYSDLFKNTDSTLKDIQRQINDLAKKTNTKHDQLAGDLQLQMKGLQGRIDRIERSIRSAKSAAPIKKKDKGKKKKHKNKKSAKKKNK